MTPDTLRLFVVSPHFDDAVFSCGELIAANPAAIVCTVFAAPPERDMSTHWDTRCGFDSAYEALRARTIEDDRALAILEAKAARLPFSDSQYNDTPAAADIADVLEKAVRASNASELLIPLGLGHSDHELVFDACCKVMPRLPGMKWFAYEEAIYRREPGVVQKRLGDLEQRGYIATPVPVLERGVGEGSVRRGRYAAMKSEAVHAYKSHLKASDESGYDDVFAPEHYWSLAIRH
ncbi:PIG-L family deacetylase [Paraburkholderia sp.]|uniref:PIG-L family deacetylase n=1 Tax=Paraburkholderia sp. TaxID=1926495 RepID=UPI002382FDBF|nr:PIG-L family deacetylase [Paraburkholderia sp.]MDE1181715.1 PIG-L family deacetylase [Paraburkholderia sp.]